MKALVTGGGGFLGAAIVRKLREQGVQVRSLSRSRYPDLDPLGVEQIHGDLSDYAAVANAISGCDLVYHVGAKAGVWGPLQDFYRINVTGTRNVIAACKVERVQRLIYTSSPSVVFDGNDMEGVDESVPYPLHYDAFYPQTKAEAERMILAANCPELSTVALRPHLIWGPGDNHLLPRMVARARAGQLRRIGSQKKLIDTVYIDNAADSHLLAAERLSPASPVAGKAYFISQGEPVEIWEMVNSLLATAGLPPVNKKIPTGLAMFLAHVFEIVHKIAKRKDEPRLTRFVVRELTTAHWFNIRAARRDLHYQPHVSIQEGLERLSKVQKS